MKNVTVIDPNDPDSDPNLDPDSVPENVTLSTSIKIPKQHASALVWYNHLLTFDGKALVWSDHRLQGAWLRISIFI